MFDTHTFLWFELNDPQLSKGAKTLIEDPASDVLFSPASSRLTSLPLHYKDPFDRLLVAQSLVRIAFVGYGKVESRASDLNSPSRPVMPSGEESSTMT